MNTAPGWIPPGPISPLDCDEQNCQWRVHGVPDKYHANELARHKAAEHTSPVASTPTTDDVSARGEAVEMLRRICPPHLSADWYGQHLATLFDRHRAEVLREAAAALEADMKRFFAVWTDEPRNSPYALGHKDASDELRHMARVPRAKADEAVS